MTATTEILRSNPSETSHDVDALAACIDACFECAQVCTACADACLAEDMVAELRRCITVDIACADVCATTGRTLSRQTGADVDLLGRLLEACRDVCRRCAEECEKHAGMHDHCRICAEVCRRTEQACERLLAA